MSEGTRLSPEAEREACSLGLDPARLTELGRRLLELRAEDIAAGEPHINSWDELEAEIAEQRGERQPCDFA